MERKLILDLITGVLAFGVFTFLWIGLFIGRKHIDWKDNYEAVIYIFFVLLLAVATLGMAVSGWFWITEHIIYIP